MKILITGGCGFIGTNLIRHLLTSTPHHVINVDKLTYAGHPESLAEFNDHDHYLFSQTDIVDLQQLSDLFHLHQPEAVIHLAAESHVDRSIDDPEAFIQTNVVGTSRLLKAATKHYRGLSKQHVDTFRFVHVSTDEVYGTLDEVGRFSESTAYAPQSPYAATKASSDHLVRAWHATYGLPVIVTNCGNNFGPYQFPEKLLPLMIIRAIREQPLPVYGTGENVRDWLYVSDHVRALMAVLQNGVIGQTYNVGGGNEQRNLDLVRLVCQILDFRKPRSSGRYEDLITFVADRPGHDLRYAIDSSKIRNELQWRPESDLKTALAETVDWYLSHADWWQAILDRDDALKRLGTASTAAQS